MYIHCVLCLILFYVLYIIYISLISLCLMFSMLSMSVWGEGLVHLLCLQSLHRSSRRCPPSTLWPGAGCPKCLQRCTWLASRSCAAKGILKGIRLNSIEIYWILLRIRWRILWNSLLNWIGDRRKAAVVRNGWPPALRSDAQHSPHGHLKQTDSRLK